MIIADSSNDEHFGRTKAEIDNFEHSFKIDQIPFPGLTLFPCLRETAPMIQTPYATFVGDDDIPVPGCLQECIDFLDENPEYSAAGGRAIGLALDYPNLEKALGTWNCYLKNFEEETAGQRLTTLLNSYEVTGYTISRSDQFLNRILPSENEDLSDVIFGNELNELLNSCMLVAQGKLKVIDRLLFVRQMHQERYLFQDSFDWVTSPQFHRSYELFRNRLAEQIASIDRIGLDEALELVKQAFWSYLSQTLTIASSRRTSRNAREVARNIAKRVPFARSVWHWSRVFLPGTSNQIKLRALLRPGSPYHKDFMPVYDAVTCPVEPKTLMEPVASGIR
jgi:glycosyltransferase domain-containing protein